MRSEEARTRMRADGSGREGGEDEGGGERVFEIEGDRGDGEVAGEEGERTWVCAENGDCGREQDEGEGEGGVSEGEVIVEMAQTGARGG